MKHDIFKKYSLVEEAFTLAQLTADIEKTCVRGMEVIEDCIDLPYDEKEALMVIAILSAGPETSFANNVHLLSERNEHVQKIAEEMEQAASGRHPTANIVRIAASMQIALYESQLSKFGNGGILSTSLAQQIRADVLWNSQNLKSLGVPLEAPRLEILYLNSVDNLLAAIDRSTDLNKNFSPRPPKNNGPSF